MDRDAITSLSETPTLASTCTERQRDSGSTCGATVTFTRDSFTMGRRMGRATGRRVAMIPVTSTRVAIRMTKSMATESSPGSLAANIKVITRTISKWATEKCTGMTEQSTEDTGRKVCSTESVS